MSCHFNLQLSALPAIQSIELWCLHFVDLTNFAQAHFLNQCGLGSFAKCAATCFLAISCACLGSHNFSWKYWIISWPLAVFLLCQLYFVSLAQPARSALAGPRFCTACRSACRQCAKFDGISLVARNALLFRGMYIAQHRNPHHRCLCNFRN